MKTFGRILPMLLLCFVAALQAQEVTIPDPGLQAAIRQALHLPSGTITAQGLLSLTNLDARHEQIGSLEGLEASYNLRSLNLFGNQLTNIASLSALTNLTSLD